MTLPTTTADHPKCLEPAELQAALAEHRHEGARIVHCHGVFDLLHPGHIAHLQEAKALGQVLVVSITSVPHVSRGPGRPVFNDEMRLFSLASLACVDYVTVAPGATAMEAIDLIQPDLYIKGHEYADPASDVTANIGPEIERVRLYGGDVAYTGRVVFSSTRLINNHLEALSPQVLAYARELGKVYSFNDIRTAVDAMRNLRVLVLGDVIIDEFIHCSVQGLTSKGRIISARYLKKELHLGGSIAIARHLATFAKSVAVAGVVGAEPEVHEALKQLDGELDVELIVDPRMPTIVKRRYVERLGRRDEYNRLFAISHLEDEGPGPEQRACLLERLERIVPDYDMVIVADYGHGLLDAETLALVRAKTPFLALNSQTNSANFGFNLITRHASADTFCLDETEIRLAFSRRKGDCSDLIHLLRDRLGARQGWLTLGSSGSLGVDSHGDMDHAPALTLHVTDTIGAGDAFFALASMSACLGQPLPVGSLLGNLAGAMAASVLGNATPVEKAALLKFATTVLNV